MELTYHDLRTRTTLVCGALSLTIAISMLLRKRVRKEHLLFAAFAGDVGFWYLSQSLFGFFQAYVWERLQMILAVLLPFFAINLFEAMVPEEREKKRRFSLGRITAVITVPVLGLELSPYFRAVPVRVAAFLYVFSFIAIGLVQLYQRGRRSSSRATKRRVGFLVMVGALACLFTVADFVWVIGYVPAYHPPPVGVVFSVVFLFILAQALRYERLLDLYEMMGKLLVATAVAFLIAGVFHLLVTVIGQFRTMYLNAVLASIVVLVLFNPLREKVEQQIQRFVLGERKSLQRAVNDVRRRLVHVLEVDQMGAAVITALEKSRSVTSAALYLRTEDATGFEQLAALGRKAPLYIEVATARALLEQLEHGPVVLEDLQRKLRDRRLSRVSQAAYESTIAAAQVLGVLSNGVVVAIRAEEGELVGLLVVADNRIRDAFSPEDATLLELLAVQMGVVVENSRAYTKMKERDRLTVLGQMAAGLAHEIRNPLGAIKGAAQLLAEPTDGAPQLDDTSREFLGIILEEVDRLDQVVNSVLDLARQNTDVVAPVDVNSVLRRTIQVMSAELNDDTLGIDAQYADPPVRAAIAPEQLHQVLMNLVRNAGEAMGGKGRITVTTKSRGTETEPTVEIAVTDTGPGIPHKALQSIFLPFFTTKDDGTGLGLAICQHIVQSAGGRIDVRTRKGEGSTFAVFLPAVRDTGAFTPAVVSARTPSPSGVLGSLSTPPPRVATSSPPAKTRADLLDPDAPPPTIR